MTHHNDVWVRLCMPQLGLKPLHLCAVKVDGVQKDGLQHQHRQKQHHKDDTSRASCHGQHRIG